MRQKKSPGYLYGDQGASLLLPESQVQMIAHIYKYIPARMNLFTALEVNTANAVKEMSTRIIHKKVRGVPPLRPWRGKEHMGPLPLLLPGDQL